MKSQKNNEDGYTSKTSVKSTLDQKLTVVHSRGSSNSISRLSDEQEVFDFRQHNILVVNTGSGYDSIPFNRLSFIKSDKNYCEIVMTNGKTLLICSTLKALLTKLNNQFISVHQSYIVNLLETRSFNITDATLTMESGAKIPVARSAKKRLKQLFR